MKRETWQRLAAVAVWAGLVAGYLYYMRSRDLSALEAAEQLRATMADNWWGPVLYIVAYAVRPLVLFPASLLTILSGLAFGIGWGAVWTIIASNLSTAVAYAVGRFVLKGALADRLISLLGSIVERARDYPFETAAVMRLLYLPFDAVGYAAGFLAIRFVPFMAGSALGVLPGTLAFVGFGASIDSLDEGRPSFDVRILLASIALAVAGSLFSRYLRRRRNNNDDDGQNENKNDNKNDRESHTEETLSDA